MWAASDRTEESNTANWILQHPVDNTFCRDPCLLVCAKRVGTHKVLRDVLIILLRGYFQQMKDLQDRDSEQLHAAFLAYMDLTEVRRWTDVSCVRSPELQLVLLEAKQKDGAPAHTVLPLPAHRSLSHRSVRHALDRGLPVLLCAVASDSTLVYQRMTDGLVTPDPPAGPFQDVARRQHRKRRQKC